MAHLWCIALKPATLLNLTLLHGCFSRFLNCTNATKSRNASHILRNYFTLTLISFFAQAYSAKLELSILQSYSFLFCNFWQLVAPWWQFFSLIFLKKTYFSRFSPLKSISFLLTRVEFATFFQTTKILKYKIKNKRSHRNTKNKLIIRIHYM